MSIVLGLDIGKARTGIARSDTQGIIIKPLKTIKTSELIQELKSMEEEYGIELLVIGEPVNLQKGNNDAYQFVMKTKADIENNFKNTKIELINEAFTSKEAEDLLKEQGKKIDKENKYLIDMYAAGIILEQYFNQQ